VIVEVAMVMLVFADSAPAGTVNVGPLGSETDPPLVPMVPVPLVLPPPPPSEPPHAVTSESALASAATFRKKPLETAMTAGENARTFPRIAAPPSR
jgi:hypothetical protein